MVRPSRIQHGCNVSDYGSLLLLNNYSGFRVVKLSCNIIFESIKQSGPTSGCLWLGSIAFTKNYFFKSVFWFSESIGDLVHNMFVQAKASMLML